MINYGYGVLLDLAPMRPWDYVEVFADDIFEFYGVHIVVGIVVIAVIVASIVLIKKAAKKNKENEE